MMKQSYEIKVRGLLGPDPKDDKTMIILNRCVEWREKSIAYEADPRHAEIIVRDLNLDKANPINAPGVNTKALPEDDDKFLDKEEATMYRRLAARCNFLSQDRPDIQYATKEVAKGMSRPK